MLDNMVVRKITVSLEETAYAAAVAAAKAAGLSLSAWLSRYAEHRARIEDGLRAAEAYQSEYSAAPVEVDEVLDDLGVGAPVPATREAGYAEALSRLRSARRAA